MDSNNIFPALPGLKWDVGVVPIFNTLILRTQSQREQRTGAAIYPLWQFSMGYELLRDFSIYTEWRTLLAFYLQQQGALTSFLYSFPSDKSVTGQQIGVGDGATTQFQLVRTFGVSGGPTWTEPITDVDSTTPFNVYLNGVLQTSGYTYGQFLSGVLTFTTPPANGAAITVDFSYYYRVRFVEWKENTSSGANQDGFNEFMYNFWELKNVSFITAR